MEYGIANFILGIFHYIKPFFSKFQFATIISMCYIAGELTFSVH